jgi:hypothetical protein
MCGHHGDFHGKGMGYGHHDGCGCHGGHHGNADCHGHDGAHFSGHGWAFLTHDERVERLVHAKKGLEIQLAEIQKTLSLLQPTGKTLDMPEISKES